MKNVHGFQVIGVRMIAAWNREGKVLGTDDDIAVLGTQPVRRFKVGGIPRARCYLIL